MRAAIRDLRRYRRHAEQWRASYRAELSWPSLVRWFGPWRRGRRTHTDPLRSEQPWMSFAAIEFLARHLAAHHRVFEWGMGGSTPFLARRASHVVSVEHDRPWFERVEQRMRQLGLDNWTGTFVAPGARSPAPRDPTDWEAYASHSEPVRDRSFRDYVLAIEGYPDATFDFVIIDGRARPACFVHALAKVKPGGFVLWDDSDRDAYQATIERAARGELRATQLPGPRPHTDAFTVTTAWQRPADGVRVG